MTHIVLILAYDGTAYFGWQKTKEGPSIEAAVKHAVEQIFQEPIVLRAASRTDRGVHAEWQVADFTTTKKCPDLHRLVISLNELLPPGIRCRHATPAPTESFHPTTDVVDKTYRYSISTGPVQLPLLRFTHWHIHHPIDLSVLHEAANLFIGTQDFRGLCNRRANLNEENTVRTIYEIDITEDQKQSVIICTLRADHFLYKMVRNIVGTIVWIARGKIPITSIRSAIEMRKRALAGVTAPAHGLSLIDVRYTFNLMQQTPSIS